MNASFSCVLKNVCVRVCVGSGQQSVTGVENADDANSYWQIRGKPNRPCQRGSAVKCGQAIRITHMKTGRNLHTHHFSSPLSNNQVSQTHTHTHTHAFLLQILDKMSSHMRINS